MSRGRHEGDEFVGLITFGFVILLIGVIFAITPNLYDQLNYFVKDFEVQQIAPNFYLPVPRSQHPVIYNALYRFCAALAIFQIVVLGIRIAYHSSFRRQASTVSSIVFWGGAAWIFSSLVLRNITWIVFFGSLVALIGLSLVIQNVIVLMVGSARRP